MSEKLEVLEFKFLQDSLVEGSVETPNLAYTGKDLENTFTDPESGEHVLVEWWLIEPVSKIPPNIVRSKVFGRVLR